MTDPKNIVLIVEDETSLRNLLKVKLESEGFGVLEAENGKVGLETALSRHPSMILLDIIMPVMDGLAVLKELRKDAWGKSALVIVLSNLSESENMDKSVKDSVSGYLVKSDSGPDDIVALIRAKLAS